MASTKRSSAAKRTALLCALAVCSCSAQSFAPLEREEATRLLDQAEQREQAGDKRGAAQILLDCIELCPPPLKHIAADRVGQLSLKVPGVERQVVRRCDEIAERVLDGSTANTSWDLIAVAVSSNMFERPEMVTRLLQRLRSSGQSKLYHSGLLTFAAFSPRALTDLSENDGLALVEAVRRAPGDDSKLVSHGSSDRAVIALELLRVGNAASFALALSRSGRPERARDVIRLAIQGMRNSDCGVLIDEIASEEDQKLLTLACEECTSAPQCGRGVGEEEVAPPPSPAEPQ